LATLAAVALKLAAKASEGFLKEALKKKFKM